MKNTIDDLLNKLANKEEEVREIYEAIIALRKVCEHNNFNPKYDQPNGPWIYDGHGHNYDVYKCNICQEEIDY